MRQDMETILFTEEELQKRVSELGEAITRDYKDKNPIFVGVLKGSFVFMADLVRCVDTPCTLDFMVVSSYGSGVKTTGAVKINKDLSEDIEGRHVIIVEDILDSGNTLAFLKEYFLAKGAASITIVTLLDKPARREKAIYPDLAGFTVPDEFVVGYGLDYAQRYRNVPYIGVLKPEVYEK